MSYLLDSHGQGRPATPIPATDRNLRPHEDSLRRLRSRGYIQAHRMRDGSMWWTLTREGLAWMRTRGVFKGQPALDVYAAELDAAGM